METVRRLVPSQLDGGPLELYSGGSGPGVVIVQGGATDVSVYRRLADRLSGGFTVHSYNRRGRGASANRPTDYDLDTEVADLRSILEYTESTRVLGHSVGGYFALAGARAIANVTHAALFDPTVSIDGSFPTGYLEEFESLIGEGRTIDAMALMGRELNMPDTRMPLWLQRTAVRAVMLTPPGRTMAQLLATVPAEARLAETGDGPASAWAAVTARTRFFIGERSGAYYLAAARPLCTVMPNASIEVLGKLGHDCVARAGAPLIASLTAFFAE